MTTAADMFVYATTLGAYGFVFRIALTTWFRTVAGRIVMALAVAALLIFTLAALTVAFSPEFPGRSAVRLGIYVATTGLTWWALAVLWTDQLRSRRRKAPRHDVEAP